MTADPGSFVDLEHASVARGEKIVLHDISLRIASGEHVAILGPNGCGKSTLIKTMTCECYPIAREPGMRVAHLRPRAMGRVRAAQAARRGGRRIAQRTHPAHRGPRRRHLRLLRQLHDLAGDARHARRCADRADAVLDQLEAGHLAEKPVGEMSAGEMRRVLIGRALVHDPEMLLIDEPSNALDLAAQSELRQSLRRLAQHGIGIVLITHHLADILPEIDRVVMMREGRIFADGPKTELLTEERLQELFGVPVTMARRDGFYHVW